MNAETSIIHEYPEEYSVRKGKFEVQEVNGYAGLFATRGFWQGDILMRLEGNDFPEPTRTSIEIRSIDGCNRHLEHYEGGNMNHHCNPSTEIVYNVDTGIQVLVVAKRDIYPGEEITFDYNTTESLISHPFQCNCHGEWIRGKLWKNKL